MLDAREPGSAGLVLAFDLAEPPDDAVQQLQLTCGSSSISALSVRRNSRSTRIGVVGHHGGRARPAVDRRELAEEVARQHLADLPLAAQDLGLP